MTVLHITGVLHGHIFIHNHHLLIIYFVPVLPDGTTVLAPDHTALTVHVVAPLYSRISNHGFHPLIIVLAPILADSIAIKTRFLHILKEAHILKEPYTSKRVLGPKQAYAPVINDIPVASDSVDKLDHEPVARK